MDKVPIADRFWPKVDRSGGPDTCWPWMGDRNHKGYGRMWRDGKNVTTSRVSWELHNGPIPARLHVCHRCDNPPCANPAHLFLGTPSINQLDSVAKGRRSGKPIKPKLTIEQVVEIRRRLASGEMGERLAIEYGVNQSQMSRIKTGKAWRFALDGGPAMPATDTAL